MTTTTHTDLRRARRHLAAVALQATTEAAVSALRDLLDAHAYAGTSFDADGARLRASVRAARTALERHNHATVEMTATIEAETDRYLDALEPRVCACGEPTESVVLDQCSACWADAQEARGIRS